MLLHVKQLSKGLHNWTTLEKSTSTMMHFVTTWSQPVTLYPTGTIGSFPKRSVCEGVNPPRPNAQLNIPTHNLTAWSLGVEKSLPFSILFFERNEKEKPWCMRCKRYFDAPLIVSNWDKWTIQETASSYKNSTFFLNLLICFPNTTFFLKRIRKREDG
jgi:hypothetical protein